MPSRPIQVSSGILRSHRSSQRRRRGGSEDTLDKSCTGPMMATIIALFSDAKRSADSTGKSSRSQDGRKVQMHYSHVDIVQMLKDAKSTASTCCVSILLRSSSLRRVHCLSIATSPCISLAVSDTASIVPSPSPIFCHFPSRETITSSGLSLNSRMCRSRSIWEARNADSCREYRILTVGPWVKSGTSELDNQHFLSSTALSHRWTIFASRVDEMRSHWRKGK